MKALVIVPFFAALAVAPAVARADEHQETELQSAQSAMGQGNDVGWSSLTPEAGPPPVAETREKYGDLTMRVSPFFKYYSPGDLDDDLGDVEVDRYGFDARAEYRENEGPSWTVRFAWEESDYDVDGPAGTFAEDALDDATVWSLSVVHQRKLDERWTGFAGVGLQFAGASGVSFSDGRNFMGGLGGTYQVDDDLTVGLGLLARDDFDDSVQVLPIPIVEWRIDERTRLHWRGPRVDVTHEIDPCFGLRAFLALESREYRVDDDVAGIPDGSIVDDAVLLGLGLDWRPQDYLTVSFQAGLLMSQEYEFQDDDGDRVEKVEMDDPVGLFLGVGATFRF